MKLSLMCVLAVFVQSYLAAEEELFRNPNFEEDFDGEENWWCDRCTLEKSDDAYEGAHSGYVTDRDRVSAGISQYVDVEPGENYYVISYLKLLDLVPGYIYHNVRWRVLFTYTNGTTENLWLGHDLYNHPDDGWHMIGTDFTVPEGQEIETTRMNINSPDTEEVNYLVDSATMKKITHNPNWKDEANARIEQLRKSNISINVHLAEECNPQDVTVHLNMTGHTYPWGSCVQGEWVYGETDEQQKYQDTFYYNFNFATLCNKLKWKPMEKVQGEVNFEIPDRALAALEDKGIPVRGHSLFWGKQANNPPWFLELPLDQWKAEFDRRTNYMLEHYAGKLVHWDVNNECITGDLYEQATQDRFITDEFFRDWKQGDPDALLFLNDYSVVRLGHSTIPYVRYAKGMLERGVPLDALGLQGHFIGMPNVDTATHRLDILAQAGLPIWITEFDIDEADTAKMADGLEDMMRLFYSRPEVDGVIMWGFWDGYINAETTALFEGPDFIINAAGIRWQQLIFNEWSTSADFNPISSEETFNIRGYQGHYEVLVSVNGEVTDTIDFTLGENSEDFDLHVYCGERCSR